MKNTARKTTSTAPSADTPKGSRATEGFCVSNEGLDEFDRLSHAMNFANELNESRLWKIRISYEKRWTRYRKTRQSVRIRVQKPWARATGPKTGQGKAAASKNAMAGDYFDRTYLIPALEANGRFLRAVNRAITLERNGHLMPDDLKTHLQTMARNSTNRLLAALLAAPNFQEEPPFHD